MSTLCRVYGYIYNAQGQVVTHGKLSLRLQQDLVSVDGTKVAPFEVSQDLAFSFGFFEKYIYATVGASPSGLAYVVEFDPEPTDTSKPAYQKDGYWRNNWAVPNTASVPIGNFVSANRGEPFANYMPLGGQLIDPELPDNIVLGLSPSGSSKMVIANQTSGSNPALRYNGGAAYWDLSDDGGTFRRIASGAGTTGKLTKWSAAGVLADSIVSESGSILTVVDTINVSTLTTPAATDLSLNPTATIKVYKDVVPDTALARKMGLATAKYLALYAAELFVDTLVAQSSLATVGGRVTVAPTTSLTANLAGGATLGFLKHNQPDKDNILYMEDSGAAEYIKVDSWPIVAVDTTAEWFEVASDFTTTFTNGRTFTVRGSTGNNGTWTVSSAAYQAGTVRTRITVTGNITNATADGYVAYLDSGPYLYRLVRNLEGGSDSWNSGDALVNTTPGFIDMYSVSGILAGTGPAIVGNVRTSTTYSAVSARWAIGNLNGLYGYVVDTYGAAFGDPAASWVKIDSVNGVRLGYNSTTKVQIDSSGNAKFTDSITAGSSNDIVTLSAVDSTYRLWIGHATAASAPFRISKTGAVTGTNVSFTAGGVTLDSTGLYINPSAASGGGTYSNDKAVRWTTDTTNRTAIWRSDDTSTAFIKDWHFEHIEDFSNTIWTRSFIYAKQTNASSAYNEGELMLWQRLSEGFVRLLSHYHDNSGDRYGWFSIWTATAANIVEIGSGTFPPTGSSGGFGTLDAGFRFTSTTDCIGDIRFWPGLALPGWLTRLPGTDQMGLALNLQWTGFAWNLLDTSNPGVMARSGLLSGVPFFDVITATAGSNPRTPSQMFSVDPNKTSWYSAGVFSWVSKSVNTVYQAATDGFVVIIANGQTDGVGSVTTYSDASNPPTTVRGATTFDPAKVYTVTTPVKRSDYYKVTTSTGAGTPAFTMFWVPMGLIG
jgi:hypothetical protein